MEIPKFFNITARHCPYKGRDQKDHSTPYIRPGNGEENSDINYWHINPMFVALGKSKYRGIEGLSIRS
jgi:hypothetical protein